MKVIISLIIFAGICLLFFHLPWGYGAGYLGGISIGTYLIFALDKIKAIKQWRRIPEMTFYCLSALGGSLAILVGEFTFGHKRSKSSFNRVFYTILILQCLIIAGVLWLKYRGIIPLFTES